MRFLQVAPLLRPLAMQSVDMGGIAVAAEGEGGRALVRRGLRIAGIADRNLRPVQRQVKPQPVVDHVDRRPGERRAAGDAARRVIGQGIDADEPCAAAAQPGGVGRVARRRGGDRPGVLRPVAQRVIRREAQVSVSEKGVEQAHAPSLAWAGPAATGLPGHGGTGGAASIAGMVNDFLPGSQNRAGRAVRNWLRTSRICPNRSRFLRIAMNSTKRCCPVAPN